MSEETILVVDDEPAIREMIATVLELADFRVLEAENAQQAHQRVVDERPDLVLLDWMLPGISGIELTRRLKRDEGTREIPVILLTAKSEEDNKILGLDVGADDYVTKPFSTRELLSRIRAVLRRSSSRSAEKAISHENLTLDPVSHRVTAGEVPVDMGPTEYRLLEFFMSHPERAYSRAQLLDQVWGGNVYVEDRTVDVHIRRLRGALEASGHDALIQTVRGSCYLLSCQKE